MSKWYNGFSPAERARGWQVSRWLIAVGGRPTPEVCSICSSTESVKYHSENYYKPWESPSVCKVCHYAIHQRFCHLRPHLFLSMLEKHAPQPGHWVLGCSLDDDSNFAAEVRQIHGSDIVHLGKYMPKVDGHVFPVEQLYPLESVEEKRKSWAEFKALTNSRREQCL